MISIRMKHILTDADGVLVNWNKGFVKFMTDKGYPQIPDTDGYYGIVERHGVTYEQAGKFITEFNESSHIAELDPYADAQEFVLKLANLGFRFTVVTSLSSDPTAAQNRKDNLHNLYGDIFDEVVCLAQGASKYDELTRWSHSGLFWIEDHIKQAEAGYQAGLKTILVKHPYNRDYTADLFPSVSHTNPWEEIYHIICKDYGLAEYR